MNTLRRAERVNLSVLWRLVLLALIQCTLDPIALEGKQCPCRAGSGFVCDEAINQCVFAGRDCDPVVGATDFRAGWSTANAILWEWEPQGEPADFVRYEIHVWDTASPEDVRIIGPEQNPELGDYFLPRTVMPDPVVQTVTHEHQPGRTYAARLVIVDPTLCAFRSDVAAVSTIADPPAEIVLFHDTGPPSLAPESFTSVDDGEGGRFLEYRLDCSSEVCSENLTLQRLDISLDRLTPAQFNTAFVEMQVSFDGVAPSYYSRVWIGFSSDCENDSTLYRFTPFTLAPGDVMLQVPLRELLPTDGSPALDHAVATADRVCQINLGGQFARFNVDGLPSRVRVDEVRIRY